MSSSFKTVLKRVSAAEVARQNLFYVDQRRKGLIKSLTTKFMRLNSNLMGGIELDTIMVASALSGGGKSTISKCLRDSISTLNLDMNFKQVVFNFEMLAHQQAGRSVVTSANIPLRKLYSVDSFLTDEEFEGLVSHYNDLASRDIDFIDVSGDAETIANTIMHIWETECRESGKTLIYEIDHALLTKGKDGDKEKDRIDDLMYCLVDVKKKIASEGGHSVGIVLSQMNREIRKIERIVNNELHRPDTSCLFGASSIEQCADYILFLHIPAKLNIQKYTANLLPTYYTHKGEEFQFPYFELVKQRSGRSDLTIPLINKLHLFDFDEMETEVFQRLLSQFNLNQKCEL